MGEAIKSLTKHNFNPIVFTSGIPSSASGYLHLSFQLGALSFEVTKCYNIVIRYLILTSATQIDCMPLIQDNKIFMLNNHMFCKKPWVH